MFVTKFTNKDLDDIQELFFSGITRKQAAKKYRLKFDKFNRCIEEANKKYNRNVKTQGRVRRHKLKEPQIKEIFDLYAKKTPQVKIAKHIGTTTTTINSIITGRFYKDLYNKYSGNNIIDQKKTKTRFCIDCGNKIMSKNYFRCDTCFKKIGSHRHEGYQWKIQ